MSRTAVLFILLALVFPAGLSAADTASISALSGKVEMRAGPQARWIAAAEGSLLEEGGAVRTGADGRALLVFPNKSKVWLKEASALEISALRDKNTSVSLSIGKIKVRVPHLRFSEKFDLRTQSAIAAVRGTELTLDYDQTGTAVMEVLYGLVKLDRLNAPQGEDAVTYVPQGRLFAMDGQGQSSLELLSRAREIRALEDWHPGFSREQRVQQLVSKARDRQDIRNYARDSGRSEQLVQSLVTNVREADLEAGRTLTDVHGNLVRVDQRMLRPDNYSMQIVNLVKRPVYDHSFGKYTYNGGQIANRLDSLQVRVDFNMALPQSLTEWGGFFKKNSGEIHPNSAMLVAANQTDTNAFYTIADKALYNSVTNKLEDNGVVYFGTLTSALGGDSAYTQLASLAKGTGLSNLADGSVSVNGTTLNNFVWAKKDASAGLNYNADNGVLYNYTADLYYIGNDTVDPDKRVWLASEQMVISNGGQIKNTTDITKSGKDPFTIAKETGGELMLYVKKDAGGSGFNQVSSVDANAATIGAFNYTLNPSKANVDLVFVPDLAMALIQRLLPTLDNIKK